MSQKQEKNRRAYLKDIHMDENGRYVYNGTTYAWSEEWEPRRRSLLKLWGLCGVLTAAAVAAGCIPAPGMGNCVYLVLPYALQVVAALSVCWGLGRMTTGGAPLREYIYKATVEELPGRAALAAVFASVTAVGELVYVFRNGLQGKTGMFILCLLLEGAAAAAAVLFHLFIRSLGWVRTDVEPYDEKNPPQSS